MTLMETAGMSDIMENAKRHVIDEKRFYTGRYNVIITLADKTCSEGTSRTSYAIARGQALLNVMRGLPTTEKKPPYGLPFAYVTKGLE